MWSRSSGRVSQRKLQELAKDSILFLIDSDNDGITRFSLGLQIDFRETLETSGQ